MISGFLQSWTMFRDAYLTAILSGVLLSIIGVVVVARGQVFLAAAVAQASTLGTALALAYGWTQPALSSIGLGVAAAFVSERRGARRNASEERVAWVFLLAASLSVLLVANHAVGMKQVQALLSSSLIGTGPLDVVMFGALALMVAVAVALVRRRLVLLLSDATMAAAVGMNVAAWSWTFASILGVAAGLSIRGSGLLFTFGCLALPPFIARNLCRRTATLFLVAPILAVIGVVSGLILAHHFDFPPGQAIVAVLSVGLVLAWLGAGIRERFVST
ncbi:MAG: metal ABC transporter permease [Verrucomicrobiales bacterium]|nr:metal ABC transporter permease [Verrucomicrobiales bacterium]